MVFQAGDNAHQTKKRKSPRPLPAFVVGGINKGGRPTSYKREYDDVVERLRLLMLTKEEIAVFFGITPPTIDLWCSKYESFNIAYASGGDLCDADIAYSLARASKGITYLEKVPVKVRTGQYTEDVKIVEVERYIPPNFNSGQLWLSNRQRGKWKLKQAEEETNANINIKISGGLPDE